MLQKEFVYFHHHEPESHESQKSNDEPMCFSNLISSIPLTSAQSKDSQYTVNARRTHSTEKKHKW